MWHRSKSANNESNSLGKDEIRAIRYQRSTLTARAIVGVKFAARSGCWSPLHQPVGRFSTTTQLRRATEWHRNFSFPPSPAPFSHRFYTVIDTMVDGQPRAAVSEAANDNVAPFEFLSSFSEVCSLSRLWSREEKPLPPPPPPPPSLSPFPSGTSSMENERDRFRMMAFTSVCRRQMSGVISRVLCHRGIFGVESTYIKINSILVRTWNCSHRLWRWFLLCLRN